MILAAAVRLFMFLGDAVMFVAPTAGELTSSELALVDHPRSVEGGLRVRAGVAFGNLLAQDGDYFGPPVNLAARLVASAEPGQVLADHGVTGQLGPDFLVEPLEPRELRGIDQPVMPYVVRAAT